VRLGIDLGGTKIEICALDTQGRARYRQRIKTPSQEGYAAIVEAIAGLVFAADQALGERGTLGLGVPGAISRASGLMKNANTTCLIGKPLLADVAQAVGRPVRLANDANCFALSEASDGAGAGAEVVFGVILGTGCGGGVVVRGAVLEGANAIAGEWGHNPLPWANEEERPGPGCYCGKQGCVETFCSGPGMARDFAVHTGQSVPARDICARAEALDPLARACVERYCERLAKSLAVVINVLDPQVIVLGGGVSLCRALYDEVPKRWGRYVFSDRVDTALRPALHGDSSGVRGAAWLW
jgi:predicted NBD/HSP70 family sugar kinase